MSLLMWFCRTDVNTGTPTLPNCTADIPSGSIQTFYMGHDEGSGDNGNLTAMNASTVTNFNRTFTYDALNRLSTMADAYGGAGGAACKGLSWSYDAWGNRTAQTVTSGTCNTWSQSYTASNRISGFSYDAAGNLLSDGLHSYSYDAEGQIIQVDGGKTASYIYDAEGRRVEKIASSVTAYISDIVTGNVIEETNGSNNLGVGYAYLNGSLVAEYKNGTTYFVHHDHLGTTRLLTTVSGSVYDAMDYLPFGEQIAGDTGTTHKFTGKERDSESGLDNFGARYMSSQLGRFMSPDPLGGGLANPQSLNKYAYVLDNPLSNTDPTGLYTCRDDPTCTSKADVKFEKSLDALRNSSDPDVARAAAAYGAINTDNGVTVGFADLSAKSEGGETVSTIGSDSQGNLRANSDVTINSKINGDSYAAAIGHEGSHVADAQDVVRSGLTGGLLAGQPIYAGIDITHYQSEVRAWGVTQSILKSGNFTQKFDCGLVNCTLGANVAIGKDQKLPAQLGEVIDAILANQPRYNQGGNPMGPGNQGPNVVNGVSLRPNVSVPH